MRRLRQPHHRTRRRRARRARAFRGCADHSIALLELCMLTRGSFPCLDGEEKTKRPPTAYQLYMKVRPTLVRELISRVDADTIPVRCFRRAGEAPGRQGGQPRHHPLGRL